MHYLSCRVIYSAGHIYSSWCYLYAAIFITMTGLWGVIQVCRTPLCMVQCTHLITTSGTPPCIINGLVFRLTLCILQQMICNFTNSVQISLIQTIKLVAFFHEQHVGVNGYMFWWLMKQINFWLGVGWVGCYLQRSLSAHVNRGVQMPTLTEENSQFLRSGSQEVSLVMFFSQYKGELIMPDLN